MVCVSARPQFVKHQHCQRHLLRIEQRLAEERVHLAGQSERVGLDAYESKPKASAVKKYKLLQFEVSLGLSKQFLRLFHQKEIVRSHSLLGNCSKLLSQSCCRLIGFKIDLARKFKRRDLLRDRHFFRVLFGFCARFL